MGGDAHLLATNLPPHRSDDGDPHPRHEPEPPKAPPWPPPPTTPQRQPADHKTTGTLPSDQQAANDGSNDSYPTSRSRKRPESSDTDFAFTRPASPFAKRAVLRTTPEKMKQTVQDTSSGWLLDKIDIISKGKGLSD